MDKNFEIEISELFGKIYDYNYKLMKRSEDLSLENHYAFMDIVDFHITSNALSLLKNLYHGYQDSIGSLQNVRCIIEGIALKRMYSAGDISTEQIELLQKQVFLIEYNEYKKFDLIDKILIPEKLERDYKEACAFYREKLESKFNNKEIEDILHSQIPFLCNPKLNHYNLISQYLGEELTIIYGASSQCIHPTINLSYKCNEYVAYELMIYSLIKEEYSSLPDTENTLQKHTALSMHSDIAQRQYKLIGEQSKLICGIANVFRGFYQENYVSDTLYTMTLLHQEMMVDCLMGFREQVKTKWKIMLELLMGFEYNYLQKQLEENYSKLFNEHAHILYLRNMHLEYDTTKAYNIYIKIFSNGCDKGEFDKAFVRTTGYTIDENGHTLSLTKMVDKFLEKSFSQFGEYFLEPVQLDYVESQILSHANGYMWFANTGAWADVFNLFKATDLIIIEILSKIQNVFELHRSIEESKKYKTIINVLRNSIKKIKPIVEERLGWLLVPGVNI